MLTLGTQKTVAVRAMPPATRKMTAVLMHRNFACVSTNRMLALQSTLVLIYKDYYIIKVYCITIIHSKFQLYVICNMITLTQQLQLIPVLVLYRKYPNCCNRIYVNISACYVPGGNCYCDPLCSLYHDCCDDATTRCPSGELLFKLCTSFIILFITLNL